MKHYSILLKTSAISWIIWGLVHILAGVLIMKGPLTGDISPLFDNLRGNSEFQKIINSRLTKNKNIREEIARLKAAGEL